MIVIPAKAGIQSFKDLEILWTPVFTGETTLHETINCVGQTIWSLPHTYFLLSLFRAPLLLTLLDPFISFADFFSVGCQRSMWVAWVLK